MSFDPKLLEKMLVCTKCRGPLVRDGDSLVCVASNCRMIFAILHEIPNMLMDEATAATAADWSSAMQRAGRGPASDARV